MALLQADAGPPGTVARRACAGFGLVRAALESLRDPAATNVVAAGWLTLPQLAALALAAGALASPLRLRRASTMPPARRKSEHGR